MCLLELRKHVAIKEFATFDKADVLRGLPVVVWKCETKFMRVLGVLQTPNFYYCKGRQNNEEMFKKEYYVLVKFYVCDMFNLIICGRRFGSI